MVYRSVETSTWDDPKVRSLPPSGKLLFVYLFTNRHSHVSGIYVLPPVLGQYETGLKGKEWDTLCDTLSSAGLCRFDGPRDVVWVVNAFRYQGRGEKNERAAARHMLALHNSPLINEFLQSYPAVVQYVPDRVCDRASEVGSITLKEQEQDIEREQEQEKPLSRSPSANGDVRRVFDYFAQSHPKSKLTDDRIARIRKHLRSYSPDELETALDGLELSSWHVERGNLTIEYGLRNAQQIDKLVAIAEDPSHPGRIGNDEAPARTRGNQAALNEWARRQDDGEQSENGCRGSETLRDVPATGECEPDRGLLPLPE